METFEINGFAATMVVRDVEEAVEFYKKSWVQT